MAVIDRQINQHFRVSGLDLRTEERSESSTGKYGLTMAFPVPPPIPFLETRTVQITDAGCDVSRLKESEALYDRDEYG
jgi:hypothetical protein